LITDLMPNARQCMVEDKKLSGYLLNIDHEHGRAKAIFFLSFGFTESDLLTFRVAPHTSAFGSGKRLAGAALPVGWIGAGAAD